MPSSTFSPRYPVRLLFPKGGRSVVCQEGFPKERRVKILFDKKINLSTFAVGILIGMVQGAESKPNTVHESHFYFVESIFFRRVVWSVNTVIIGIFMEIQRGTCARPVNKSISILFTRIGRQNHRP